MRWLKHRCNCGSTSDLRDIHILEFSPFSDWVKPMKLRVLRSKEHPQRHWFYPAMSEEACKEDCVRLESGAQASDAFAALQVKKIAKSQGDPKKTIGQAMMTFDNGTMEVDTLSMRMARG